MNTETKSRSPGRRRVVVEIGDDWLKLARVERTRGGPAVSKLHLEKLSESGGSARGAVSRAVKELGLVNASATACLPRKMVNIRMLELPSTDPAEIGDMIDLQVGKQTPYSKDEIVFDGRAVGQGREGYTRVMLAIVQKGILREYFGMLEEAGLEIERMTVSTEGLAGWWQHLAGARRGGAAALLEIDSSSSDFSVVSPDGLLFTRSIMLGSDELCRDGGQSRDKFAREVKHSIEMCREETGGIGIGKLVVVGAGRSIEGLDASLNSETGLGVEVVDCMEGVKLSSGARGADEAQLARVSLAPLIGLGAGPEAIGFNLVPDSVRLRRRLERKARSMQTVGAMGMTALVTISMFATVRLNLTRGRLEALRARLAAVESTARQVEIRAEILKAVRKRGDRRLTAINVFAELHPLVPQGAASFESLEMNADQKTVRLAGVAKGRSDVSVLVQKLNESGLFADAKTDGAVVEEMGRYKFAITCALEAKK